MTIVAPTKCCCALVASTQPLLLLLYEGVRSFHLPFAEPRPQKATIKKAWKLFALPFTVDFWTTNRKDKHKKSTPISVNFMHLILFRH